MRWVMPATKQLVAEPCVVGMVWPFNNDTGRWQVLNPHGPIPVMVVCTLVTGFVTWVSTMFDTFTGIPYLESARTDARKSTNRALRYIARITECVLFCRRVLCGRTASSVSFSW